METVTFHLPTKPYSLIDAINRAAIATGSIQNAMYGADANYNGHYNSVYFNEYRQYYVGDYTWAGRNVFARSADAVVAVRAGIDEFKRQGRGASLHISVRAKDADAVRAAFPELIEGKPDPEDKPSWYNWKYSHVGYALRGHQTHLLMRARDAEHYRRLQGFVPVEGGERWDGEAAAREWAAVSDLPMPDDVGAIPMEAS